MEYRQELERLVSTFLGYVIWPKHNDAVGTNNTIHDDTIDPEVLSPSPLKIGCNVDPQSNNVKFKIKKWQTLCEKKVLEFFSELDSSRKIYVAQQVRPGVVWL